MFDDHIHPPYHHTIVFLIEAAATASDTVDYLAPYQPTDFEHPNGVPGRQFVSSKDWIASSSQVENASLEKGNFGKIGHWLGEDFYNFLLECFNNGVPIEVIY